MVSKGNEIQRAAELQSEIEDLHAEVSQKRLTWLEKIQRGAWEAGATLRDH